MKRILFDEFLSSLNSRIELACIANRVKIEHKTKGEYGRDINIYVDDQLYAHFDFFDHAEKDNFQNKNNESKLTISSSITIFRIRSSDQIIKSVKFRGNINSYNIIVNGTNINDLDDFLNIIFPLPDDKKLRIIADVFNTQNFGYELFTTDIKFDFATNVYSLSDDIDKKEEENLANLFSYNEISKFCKYTSLETFFSMIQSRKIRMNGLMAMNDMHEAYYINQHLYPDTFDRDRTIVKSDKILITSFSSLEDDLKMWRLYGNDACGICMVFSTPSNVPNSTFNEVLYGGKHLSKYKSIIDKLREKGISFEFKSIDGFKYFFKSQEYAYEKEYRLVTKTTDEIRYYIESHYKSITPYKDFNLLGRSMVEKDSDIFPLKLKKIILGPNLPSLESNYPLLVKICNEWNIEVVKSSIHTYR